jgi:uncharacterized protein YuzE
MEVKYDAKTDAMYIRLNHAPFHKNQVVNDAMIVDLAEDGTIIGIELISPSRYVENVEEMIYRYQAKTTAPETK